MQKSMPNKRWILMKNQRKHETRFSISSKIMFVKKQVFGKGCNHADPYIHAVECVSGRVRPKMRKSKIREQLKKHANKTRKSYANNLKQTWTMEPQREPKLMKHPLKNRSGKKGFWKSLFVHWFPDNCFPHLFSISAPFGLHFRSPWCPSSSILALLASLWVPFWFAWAHQAGCSLAPLGHTWPH